MVGGRVAEENLNSMCPAPGRQSSQASSQKETQVSGCNSQALSCSSVVVILLSITQVSPGQQSEHMSLGDWIRPRGMWRAVEAEDKHCRDDVA